MSTDEDGFIQCPHEVGRATCIGFCNCDCGPCAPSRANRPERCDATTPDGLPCQKRGPHAGHWFMSDDMWACMNEDHYDPTNVLSLTPLVHRDVPCTRVAHAQANAEGQS